MVEIGDDGISLLVVKPKDTELLSLKGVVAEQAKELVKAEDLKYDLRRFGKFNDTVLIELIDALNNFRDGSFANLEEIFSFTKTQQLGQLIINNGLYTKEALGTNEGYKRNSELFYTYKDGYHKVLDGLNRGIEQHRTNTNLEINNEALTETNKILYDKDLLLDFIQTYYHSYLLFEVGATMSVAPQIKLQYFVYLQRHGRPQNGVFDSELLSAITAELLEAGEITQADL